MLDWGPIIIGNKYSDRVVGNKIGPHGHPADEARAQRQKICLPQSDKFIQKNADVNYFYMYEYTLLLYVAQ